MKEIKCDHCDSLLNEPDPYPDYYLNLTAKPKPTTDIVYAVMVYPPIDQNKDFCGLKCLQEWINNAQYLKKF